MEKVGDANSDISFPVSKSPAALSVGVTMGGRAQDKSDTPEAVSPQETSFIRIKTPEERTETLLNLHRLHQAQLQLLKNAQEQELNVEMSHQSADEDERATATLVESAQQMAALALSQREFMTALDPQTQPPNRLGSAQPLPQRGIFPI
jgi:hypothetical protein